MANNVSRSQRCNLVWQHFSQEEGKTVCNICRQLFEKYDRYATQIKHLERHLWYRHREIVEKIRDEIKATWLPQFLTFDVRSYMAKCIFCCRSISIFRGINCLKDHLFSRHKIGK